MSPREFFFLYGLACEKVKCVHCVQKHVLIGVVAYLLSSSHEKLNISHPKHVFEYFFPGSPTKLSVGLSSIEYRS